MIVIVCLIVGALVGLFTARKRKGNKLDQLQFAVVYAVAFALLGLFATVVLERML